MFVLLDSLVFCSLMICDDTQYCGMKGRDWDIFKKLLLSIIMLFDELLGYFLCFELSLSLNICLLVDLFINKALDPNKIDSFMTGL